MSGPLPLSIPLSIPVQIDDGSVVGTPALLESSRVTWTAGGGSTTSGRGAAPAATVVPIPTPSAYVDARGEIHNVRVGQQYHHLYEQVKKEEEERVWRRLRAHQRKTGLPDDPSPLTSDADAASTTTTTSTSTSSTIKQTRYNILYTKAGVMRSGDLHKDVQHDFVFEGCVRVWLLHKDGTTIHQVYGPHAYICIPPYTPHIFEFLQDTVVAEWWDGNEFCAWYYQPYRDVVEQRQSKMALSSATLPKGRLLTYSLQTRSIPFIFSWKFLLGVATGISVGAWITRR